MNSGSRSGAGGGKAEGGGAQKFKGQSICITGFRDKTISSFIELHGGKVQSAVNSKTNMVIIKDSSYSNKKTETA